MINVNYMSIKITKRQEIVDDEMHEIEFHIRIPTELFETRRELNNLTQSELNELYELLAQHVKKV